MDTEFSALISIESKKAELQERLDVLTRNSIRYPKLNGISPYSFNGYEGLVELEFDGDKFNTIQKLMNFIRFDIPTISNDQILAVVEALISSWERLCS